MNSYHHLLTLSGYGYLDDIITQGNQIVARLKAVTPIKPNLDESRVDDVWIDCVVTDQKHLAYLKGLLPSVQAGVRVRITFEAEYQAFINAYSGQSAEDPNHIVTLQVKLLKLGDSTINGCLAKQNKFWLHAVA